MNLTTRYLGIRLKNPLMVGASPMADDLGTVRRLEGLDPTPAGGRAGHPPRPSASGASPRRG